MALFNRKPKSTPTKKTTDTKPAEPHIVEDILLLGRTNQPRQVTYSDGRVEYRRD